MGLLKALLAAGALALAIGVSGTTSAFAVRTDLVLGVTLEPPHLDPTAGAAAAIDEVLYANVFEGLTRIGPDGEVLPDLAESWTISDDGKVYIFKLHSGVKFHDGTDFDASDVKFSLDRARATNSVNAQKQLFAAIDTVEIVDPATVKITLKHPQGAFLYNMGWGDAVMVAPESAATNKQRPIGTGPFKFQNWAKGSSITLVKSDHYWGDPVFLDKVQFRIIPDPAAAVPAMLSGDVQAFPFFPPDAVSQLQDDPNLQVEVGSTEGETILAMNNKKKPLDDLKVRQAISYALDRQAIIEGASGGLGVPIGSHMSPSSKAYLDLTGEYPHDVAKAKELLKEAGMPDGFKATLKLPPPDYARLGGEIVASQLRDVGIDLEIIPMEWAQWLDQVFTKKDYDLTIVSHTEPNDIDIYSRRDYYFNYQNPEFNKGINELNLTADETRRDELLEKAQKILADDAVVGFLFELPKVGVWNKHLQGFWKNAPIQANDLTKVKWTD
ncbi:ABC transporter substrate-binding protein [Manganibacter manganicus]|uniref:ABC transporter substrate-binding protein n=1 Tax=Manganibacter manganicus TaxID=1873176 RepID=A0A1V8RWE0_9HYPH|nr:ABC transporter substrate-binding protein [Pseudaminobacter manganicus]OQM77507.1 ABC transporter substrate-binding protein [Pseudaminobacter manganicus]